MYFSLKCKHTIEYLYDNKNLNKNLIFDMYLYIFVMSSYGGSVISNLSLQLCVKKVVNFCHVTFKKVGKFKKKSFKYGYHLKKILYLILAYSLLHLWRLNQKIYGESSNSKTYILSLSFVAALRQNKKI